MRSTIAFGSNVTCESISSFPAAACSVTPGKMGVGRPLRTVQDI